MTKPKIFLQVPEVNAFSSSIKDLSTATPNHLRWSEEDDRNCPPLFVTDVQHALSYAIQGHNTSFHPRWCKFLRWTKISKVIVINIEKIGINEYKSSSSLNFLKEFPMVCIWQNKNILRSNYYIIYLLFHLKQTAEFATPKQYDNEVEEELFRVAYSKTSLQKAKDLDLVSNYHSLLLYLKNIIWFFLYCNLIIKFTVLLSLHI